MASETDNIKNLKTRVDKLVRGRWELNKEMMLAITDIHNKNNDAQNSSVAKVGIELNKINYNNFVSQIDTISTKLNLLSDQMDRNCDCLSKICNVFNKQTQDSDFKDHLDDLCSNRKQLEEECASLEIFSKEFQLVEGDYSLLNSSIIAPIKEYLRIIGRIKIIMSTCVRLSISPYNSLSEKLISQMTKLMEVCYEKISACISNTFVKSLQPHQISSDFNTFEAIKLIKDQPVYFDQCMLGYVNNRRSAISYEFQRKLKLDPQYNLTLLKPSTDPTLSIESFMDYLVDLFRKESEMLTDMISSIFQDNNDILIKDYIGNIFDPLVYVLRDYYEKIFSLRPPITSVWLIIQLLIHYIPTINGFIHSTCIIIPTLNEIKGNAIQIYSSYVLIYGKKISSHSLTPTSSLEPSPLLKEASILVETLTSMGSDSLATNEEIIKLKTLLVTTVVNALLQSCHLSASTLDLRSMAIYLINSFHNLLKIYNYFETATNNKEYITSQINAHVDTLVTEQSCYVFSTLKITKIYQACQSIICNPSLNFMVICETDDDQLAHILTVFKTYVKKKELMFLPELNLILEPNYKSTILKRYQRVIESAYDDISSAISNIPKLATIFNDE